MGFDEIALMLRGLMVEAGHSPAEVPRRVAPHLDDRVAVLDCVRCGSLIMFAADLPDGDGYEVFLDIATMFGCRDGKEDGSQSNVEISAHS